MCDACSVDILTVKMLFQPLLALLLLAGGVPLAELKLKVGNSAGPRFAYARHLPPHRHTKCAEHHVPDVVGQDWVGIPAELVDENLRTIPTRASKTSRSLQQDPAASKAEVLIVTTAEGLQDAFKSSAAHIEIQAHLDLTTLPLVNSMVLGEAPGTLKTIRVRLLNSLLSARVCQGCPGAL